MTVVTERRFPCVRCGSTELYNWRNRTRCRPCHMRYLRAFRNKDAAVLAEFRIRPSREQVFWTRVQKADGEACWPWIGDRNRFGHGVFRIGAKRIAASRAAWIFANGPIPDGMFVCHHCDNPACVRLDHLFVGTHDDNMADMATKKRSCIGEKNRHARATADDVREFRRLAASGLSYVEISKRTGFSYPLVQQAASGRCWKHL